MKAVVACCFAAVLAAACAERDRQEEGTSFATDARVRAIMPAESNATAGEAGRVVCVEPSPDVALSIADALSASRGDVAVAAEPQGARSPSNSDVLTIVQIGERLTAIQLLSDGMYRACTAYANGAISSTTYTQILSRYDDLMVTLILAQDAAAEHTPTAPIVGASTDTADAKAIADARDQVTTAAKALADAAEMPDADAAAQAARQQALVDAGAKLDDAMSKLAKLELQAMSTAINPP